MSTKNYYIVYLMSFYFLFCISSKILVVIYMHYLLIKEHSLRMALGPKKRCEKYGHNLIRELIGT